MSRKYVFLQFFSCGTGTQAPIMQHGAIIFICFEYFCEFHTEYYSHFFFFHARQHIQKVNVAEITAIIACKYAESLLERLKCQIWNWHSPYKDFSNKLFKCHECFCRNQGTRIKSRRERWLNSYFMTLMKRSLWQVFQVDTFESKPSDLTTHFSLVIWAIVLNGKTCHPNCSLLSPLNRPLCHCSPNIVSGYDWLPVSNWFVKRKLFTFALAEQKEKKKEAQTVFAQWCHLKYAGTVDVYWKVKRRINKGWRCFRSAPEQNIELLSICHLISHFFVFLGFQVTHWITLVLCKWGKEERQRATPHWSTSQNAEHGHNRILH